MDTYKVGAEVYTLSAKYLYVPIKCTVLHFDAVSEYYELETQGRKGVRHQDYVFTSLDALHEAMQHRLVYGV